MRLNLRFPKVAVFKSRLLRKTAAYLVKVSDKKDEDQKPEIFLYLFYPKTLRHHIGTFYLQSPYIHAGIGIKDPKDKDVTVYHASMIQGRIIKNKLSKMDWKHDVFELKDRYRNRIDVQKLKKLLEQSVGKPYGYSQFVYAALTNFPLWRPLVKPIAAEVETEGKQCAQFVKDVLEESGVDPLPQYASSVILPEDLAKSPIWKRPS